MMTLALLLQINMMKQNANSYATIQKVYLEKSQSTLLRMSKGASLFQFPIYSDSKEGKITPELLQDYKTYITDCAKLFPDSNISDDPPKLLDCVKKKINEKHTKRARIRQTLEDIKRISDTTYSLTEIQARIEDKKAEILKIKNDINDILSSNQKTIKKLNAYQEKISLESQINELTLLSSSLDQKLLNANNEYSNLQSKHRTINDDFQKVHNTNIAQELSEQKMKRENIQTAVNSLRAEEEKKKEARQLFFIEKVKSLTSKLNEIKQSKSSIIQNYERTIHLQKEIERYSELISVAKKHEPVIKPPPFYVQEEVVKPVNKDRIGRLISLLFRDGYNQSVIDNLAEELNWSKSQVEDFQKIIKGENGDRFADIWADWLNKTATD